MKNRQKLNSLGLDIPSILLPKTGNPEKWAVIACDQFTQDRDYWNDIKKFAGDDPSTINLIFPEVFLPDDGAGQRIAGIHSVMNQYLQKGIFGEALHGFIYIERDTPYNKKRRGLIAAIDLEHYDWHPEARPLIRCTEGTVPERLPPRMDIRRGAPLELPHVLLLIDDDTNTLLPSLGESVRKNTPCYNTQLMMDSGSVTGWFTNSESDLDLITNKLDELYMRSYARYENSISAAFYGAEPFLFAVGDGNHSLAAAKGIWEEIKAAHPGSLPDHPCRYALAEIENIYDPAIQFEPIHRFVFGLDFDKAISLLSDLPDFSCTPVNSIEELSRLCAEQISEVPAKKPVEKNRFGIICEGRYALVKTSAAGIATASLQPILDKYAADNPNLIDYIHDENELFRLAAKEKAAAILLPPVQKSGLFETVARFGPLPRKSFSMGHSREKRFYMEARSLV
jgi:hypothetical protein